ncbi:MAG: actin-binding WH2 domain-containing protein [Coleofasciculus sp. S288]|nr:actin-binding WH2 domain-containing protein [Coleofasciculus sp. S288]
MNHFSILMHFLRDREKFLEEISKGIRLEHKIVALLLSSSFFFAIYGAIIGSSSGLVQLWISALKLPALYLLTLVICLPALYFFDIISGSNRSFGQYVALLLASMSLISVMLFSFAPITLFFRLSINDYTFFKILNVGIFAFTGLIGINSFYRNLIFIHDQDSGNLKKHTAIVKAWLVLYGFVGSQLGWTLRPFFGTPDQPFQLFRTELDSNFYLHIWQVITGALGSH